MTTISKKEIVATLARLRDAIGDGHTSIVLTAAIDQITTAKETKKAEPLVAASNVDKTLAERRRAAALQAWITRRQRAAEAEAEALKTKRSAGAKQAWETRRQRNAAQAAA